MMARQAYSTRSRKLSACWLVAGVAIVGLLLTSAYVWYLRGENGSLKEQLYQAQDIGMLLESPATRLITLSGMPPHQAAYGKLTYDPQQRSAIVHVYGLPQLPQSEVFRLWIGDAVAEWHSEPLHVDDNGHANLTINHLPDLGSSPVIRVTRTPVGQTPSVSDQLYLSTIPQP